MALLAHMTNALRADAMATLTRLDPDTAWTAFMRRDRSWDGRVFGAVHTTGIYCKPSCAARRPKRENVAFYRSIEEARAAGFRPCLRCKPDEVGRDREAVAAAVAVIEQAEEAPSLPNWPRPSVTLPTISSASSSATSASLRRNMRALCAIAEPRRRSRTTSGSPMQSMTPAIRARAASTAMRRRGWA